MRIKDIKLSEIFEKKYWIVTNYDDNDPLSSKIKETVNIKDSDLILHSAVMVEKGGLVYPLLVSKYYEDGGEIGEYYIYINSKWQMLDDSVCVKNEILGTYYSYISTKDIHEYQAGSFDNRKSNYLKFDHYISQIGRSKVDPFIEKINRLSKKVLQLSVDAKINYLRELLLESISRHNNGKIALGNRKVTEAYEIVELLKNDSEGCKKLKKLLSDENKHIRLGMMYQLLEMYKKECMKMIKETAKEDTIEGLAARMNLKTIKEKGKLA